MNDANDAMNFNFWYFIDCIYTAGDALQLAPLDEVNVDTSKTAFDVRVFGVLRVVKVVKSLFNKGGSLTLTTGTVAYKPSKGWAVGSAMGGATEVSAFISIGWKPPSS